MAQAIDLGVTEEITLATTQTLLTGARVARRLTIDTATVDVYVVVVDPVDGAALPSTGRYLVPSASMPYSRTVSHGAIAVAGSAPGTCELTLE